MAQRTFINDSHRKYEEACMKEVAEMSRHPLSNEQFFQQSRRNKEQAMKSMSERGLSI